jgi:hypothetical protein
MGLADLYAGMGGITDGMQVSEDRQASTRLKNMQAMQTYMAMFPDATPDQFYAYVDKVAGGDNWERGQLPTQEIFQSFADAQERRRVKEKLLATQEDIKTQLQKESLFTNSALKAAEFAANPDEYRDMLLASVGPELADEARKRLDINGAANDYNMMRDHLANKYAKELSDMGVHDAAGVQAFLGPARKGLSGKVTQLVESAYQDKAFQMMLQERNSMMTFMREVDPRSNPIVAQALIQGQDIEQTIAPMAKLYRMSDAQVKEVADFVKSQTEAINRVAAVKTGDAVAGDLAKIFTDNIEKYNKLAQSTFATDSVWTGAGLSKSQLGAAKVLGNKLITDGYAIQDPMMAVGAVKMAIEGKIGKDSASIASAAGLRKADPLAIQQMAKDTAAAKYTPRPYEMFRMKLNDAATNADAALMDANNLFADGALPDEAQFKLSLGKAQRQVDTMLTDVAMLTNHPEIATDEKAADVRLMLDRANNLQAQINMQVNEYQRRKAIGGKPKTPTNSGMTLDDGQAIANQQTAAAQQAKQDLGNAQGELLSFLQDAQQRGAWAWNDDVLYGVINTTANDIVARYPGSGLTPQLVREYLTKQLRLMRMTQGNPPGQTRVLQPRRR